MNLTDIVKGVEQVVLEMKATTRWEAIDELIEVLVKTGQIHDDQRAAVTEAVKKRETSMSTGIGLGIGIPHAPSELISEVVGAFGRSSKGINFDSLDNQPVNLVMLFVVPKGQFQKHLYTLANIAKILHDREFRKRLETAPTAAEILRVICDHEKQIAPDKKT
jgi:PTS system nitrogen regulatory IIA component